MSALADRPYRKMNGLGNDFIILDARRSPLRLTPAEARALADRTRGIGCDQIVILEPSPAGADVFLRFLNADGSESGACGNASRCVGRLLMDETGQAAATLETRAGLLHAFDGGAWERVTVDMGVPRLRWNDIPLSEPFHDTRHIELAVGPADAPVLHSPAAVNMGNPHIVFFVEALDVVDLAKVGPMLEHHPLFPERTNVSLARVEDRAHLTLAVWERGAGLTRACGSAACAATVAAVRRRRTGREVAVTLPGGTLAVAWRAEDDHVLMTGAIALEHEGRLPADLAAQAGP